MLNLKPPGKHRGLYHEAGLGG